MDFVDFTLFDVFSKGGLIYMILSINNNVVSEKDLIVRLNNNILDIKHKYVKNVYEPVLIMMYNMCDDSEELNIEIEYNGLKFKKIIERIKEEKKGELALTTLFKNDYILFENFYNYYKSQGVDHFYMYYNGKLNEKISEYIKKEDVSLIEWDFRYWNEKSKYEHHAQLGQIHDAIYKYGKCNYDYMIFNDLDEYLFIPEKKIIDYIRENKEIDTFGFCNIWCNRRDGLKEFGTDILIDKKLGYKNRSKAIHKLESINTISIHNGYSYNKKEVKIDLENVMYHFYNLTKNRKMNLRKEKKLDLDFLLN